MPKRKRSIECQDNDLKDNWRPIRSLHECDLFTLNECDLAWQLKFWKLPTNGEKQDLVDRLGNHIKNLRTFETLPDKIILKIFKMISA